MEILSREAAPAVQVRRSPVESSHRVRHHIIQVVNYVILVWLAIVTGFPLFWMIITSIKERREVFGTFLPTTIDFSNYARVWTGLNLSDHLLNSVFVTGLTVTIVIVTVTLAAYAFARLEFPGRDIIFYIFLAAIMIPGHAILIPMFTFLKRIDLLNTLPGLSFSFLGGSIPFAIFLMRAFFKTLPSELGDAGRIDGCSEFGVFRHVYLPLARPGVATILIFQFVGTWNEFLFSTTFISDPDLKTIQPAVYQAVGRYSVDYAALSSGLVMALIPIVAMYLLMQRQFIKGLTAGALQG
jgi:ABC-type glycerol-3-phosphate transport system permease component